MVARPVMPIVAVLTLLECARLAMSQDETSLVQMKHQAVQYGSNRTQVSGPTTTGKDLSITWYYIPDKSSNEQLHHGSFGHGKFKISLNEGEKGKNKGNLQFWTSDSANCKTDECAHGVDIPETHAKWEFSGNSARMAQRINLAHIGPAEAAANPRAVLDLKFLTAQGRMNSLVAAEDEAVVTKKIKELCERAVNCLCIQEQRVNKVVQEDESIAAAKVSMANVKRQKVFAESLAKKEGLEAIVAKDEARMLKAQITLDADSVQKDEDAKQFERFSVGSDRAEDSTTVVTDTHITWLFTAPKATKYVDIANKYNIYLDGPNGAEGKDAAVYVQYDAQPPFAIPMEYAKWEFAKIPEKFSFYNIEGVKGFDKKKPEKKKQQHISYATLSATGRHYLYESEFDPNGPGVGVIKYQTEKGRSNAFILTSDINKVKDKVAQLCHRAANCIFFDQDSLGEEMNLGSGPLVAVNEKTLDRASIGEDLLDPDTRKGEDTGDGGVANPEADKATTEEAKSTDRES